MTKTSTTSWLEQLKLVLSSTTRNASLNKPANLSSATSTFPTGIKPDPAKMYDIKKMPTPQDELQSLLGILNFLSQYIPKLAEKAHPPCDLLKPQSAWAWDTDHQKRLKELISADIFSPITTRLNLPRMASSRVLNHIQGPINSNPRIHEGWYLTPVPPVSRHRKDTQICQRKYQLE